MRLVRGDCVTNAMEVYAKGGFTVGLTAQKITDYWNRVTVNRSKRNAGPPSRFFITPAAARFVSIGDVKASIRPRLIIRSIAERKVVSRTSEFEIMILIRAVGGDASTFGSLCFWLNLMKGWTPAEAQLALPASNLI